MRFERDQKRLVGTCGSLPIADDHEVTRKLLMLIEGECEEFGPRNEPAQTVETQVGRQRTQSQFCDPLAIERGVRQLLQRKSPPTEQLSSNCDHADLPLPSSKEFRHYSNALFSNGFSGFLGRRMAGLGEE
jgi:hypothetical protein